MSGTVTISDQRSYIKIGTLYGKNPTKTDRALSEVCGEFTVDCTKVSWANCFCGGCMNVGNNARPGRLRTSTDERSEKLVADSLKEDCRAKCKERSRVREQKLRRKMHKNRPQLLSMKMLARTSLML